MGAVDLVVQVESPKSVARGLQRIGRAGHTLEAVSKGRIFPKFRADLLESAVVVRRMREGAIEETQIPRNPLRRARAADRGDLRRGGDRGGRAAPARPAAKPDDPLSVTEGVRPDISDEPVASTDYKGWSLYGAPWLQPVATGRKSRSLHNPRNKPKPLPWVATACGLERMVRRGSPVRVRKRACPKAPQCGLLPLQLVALPPACTGMEQVLEQPEENRPDLVVYKGNARRSWLAGHSCRRFRGSDA
jgi:hypothetical protein